MPLDPQPRDRRGTVGRPYSALNLCLALAVFVSVVSVVSVVFAVLLRAGSTAFGWLFIALAVIAAVDLVVVAHHRRSIVRAAAAMAMQMTT